MYNNKLISEAYRMIELSGESPKNIKLLKEVLERKINKKIIKETDEDDDFFGDIMGNNVDDKSKLSKEEEIRREAIISKLSREQNSYDPKDDISNALKIALLTDAEGGGLDRRAAEALGFVEDDFVTINDLYTKQKVSGKRVGATQPAVTDDGIEDEIDRVSRRELRLYNISSEDFFIKATNNGKVFIKTPGTYFYKWLSKKSISSIGIDENNGKISKNGNATLNFLGRVLSGLGLRQGERELMALAGESHSKNEAYKMLQDSYKVFTDNHILSLINASYIEEFKFEIEESVARALGILAGVPLKEKGAKITQLKKDFADGEISQSDFDKKLKRLEKIKISNWDGTRNLSPWVLEVIKNDLKDYQKHVSDKPSNRNLNDVETFFERMMQDDGVITIVSKKEPTHEHLASKVEKYGNKWRYLYDNINSAISDLEDSNYVPAHHMKKENTGKDYAALYGSRRLKPVNQSSMPGRELPDYTAGNQMFDKSSEDGIKAIIGDAVEFMADSTTKSGLSRKTSTKLNPGNAVVKKAKDNIINFIYNNFLGVKGDSIVQTVKDTNPDSDTYGKNIKVYDHRTSEQPKLGLNKVSDIGDTGKLDKEVIVNWIESQNKKMTRELVDEKEKSLNKKLNKDEIKNLIIQAEKDKLLIDPTKDLQKLRNVFIEYLKKDGNKAFNKIRDLIGSAPPEGLEEAVKTLKKLIGYNYNVNSKQNANLTLEQKIRTKIKKILRESFVLNEDYEHVDLDNLEDLDNQINNASNFYKEKASGVSDSNINKINSYIKNVITGVNSNNERYTYGDNQQIFFFIIQIMAVLYNNIDETQKINIINYITEEIYSSDNIKKFRQLVKNSDKGLAIINKASNLKRGDSNEYVDLIIDEAMLPDNDGVYPIEKALMSFDIKKGGFLGWFINVVAHRLDNFSKKYDSGYSRGKDNVPTSSLDVPAPGQKDDDSGVSVSVHDTIQSQDSKGENDNRFGANEWAAWGDYLVDRNFISDKFLDYFNLMTRYIGNNEKFSPKLAANELNISPGNSRVIAARIRTALHDSRGEELTNYIEQRTGTRNAFTQEDKNRLDEEINLLLKLIN